MELGVREKRLVEHEAGNWSLLDSLANTPLDEGYETWSLESEE